MFATLSLLPPSTFWVLVGLVLVGADLFSSACVAGVCVAILWGCSGSADTATCTLVAVLFGSACVGWMGLFLGGAELFGSACVVVGGVVVFGWWSGSSNTAVAALFSSVLRTGVGSRCRLGFSLASSVVAVLFSLAFWVW